MQDLSISKTSLKKVAAIYKFIKPYSLFFLLCTIWIVVNTIIYSVYGDIAVLYYLNGLHTHFLDNLNVVFSCYGRGDVITFVFLSLLILPFCRNKKYIKDTATFGALIGICVFVVKRYFDKNRPLYTYRNLHTVSWSENSIYYSLPSGHTMGAFGFFTFLILYFGIKNKAAQILFFLLAAACGYSRIYLAQHYLSDVILGGTLGILISVFLNYYLIKKEKSKV